MWIETEDGKLVNLGFVEIIDALDDGTDTEPGIYAFPPAHYECSVRTKYLIVSSAYLKSRMEQDEKMGDLLNSTTLLINMLGLMTDMLSKTKKTIITSNEWLAVFRKEYAALKKSLLAADKAAVEELGTPNRRPKKK
jgi:hypothetical protein